MIVHKMMRKPAGSRLQHTGPGEGQTQLQAVASEKPRRQQGACPRWGQAGRKLWILQGRKVDRGHEGGRHKGPAPGSRHQEEQRKAHLASLLKAPRNHGHFLSNDGSSKEGALRVGQERGRLPW